MTADALKYHSIGRWQDHNKQRGILCSAAHVLRKSANFEQKIFAPKLAKRLKNRQKIFCSKQAETKILLSNVDMGIKLYFIIFFCLCTKKIELM